MLRTLMIIGLLVIAPLFAPAQMENALNTNAQVQKVIQSMNEWTDLSNKHEIAALDKLLPSDLVLTFQDGEVVTKDEYIASLKKNPADFNIKDFDQKVDLHGNVAIMRARYQVTIGANVRLDCRSTTTFLKRNGRWQPIAFHSSPLVKK